MSSGTAELLEGTRLKSATIKERVDERSSSRKEERQRAREAELKEQELFLLKAKEVLQRIIETLLDFLAHT